MRLDQVKKGQIFQIISIPSKKIRSQVQKFGIAEGAVVNCYEIIPGGPVVVKNRRQEIAIGRKLASQIEVETITKRTFIPNWKWKFNLLARSK